MSTFQTDFPQDFRMITDPMGTDPVRTSPIHIASAGLFWAFSTHTVFQRNARRAGFQE